MYLREFLIALAAAVVQPGIGSAAIAKWLQLASSVAVGVTDVQMQFKLLADQINVMVAEDRAPTEPEWTDLHTASDDLSARIQAAAAKRKQPKPPPA